MNQYIENSLKSANRVYQKVNPKDFFGLSDELVQYKGQAASDLIKSCLTSNQPAMVCRIGMVELYCLLTFYYIKQDKPLPIKILNYITGKSFPFWWDSAIKREMSKNAGFINPKESELEKFCELMLADMAYVDVLASWMKGEKIFFNRMHNIKTISIWDIEPFKHSVPWSEALEGKNVLVVHPYEQSILSQYKNRDKLFKNPQVLPSFNLKVIKAVQSIAFNETPFNSWFDALDSMKDKINNSEFDIAILGCGAYGFPLAAHVKRMGKKAVHMGGATQLMFGIKGKRWEDDPYFATQIINEHWIKPSQEETPKLFSKIEDGCYW